MSFQMSAPRFFAITILSFFLSLGTSNLYGSNVSVKKAEPIKVQNDQELISLLGKATQEDDERLKTFADDCSRDGWHPNHGEPRHYGYAARIHLRRAELGIAGAKDDFYRILENFHKLYSNYSSEEAKKLYPICLEEIRKGDLRTKQLVEQNYTKYGFLQGIFQYYVNKGDDASIKTAWELYQQNKKITYKNEKNEEKSFEITYHDARPLIEYYKKKADQGDLEACRRITEMAMPEATYLVSFSTATVYYAKALDLKDPTAKAGLLKTLKRLTTTAYEGGGIKPDFLNWALNQNDTEILVATGEALVKTHKEHHSARDFVNAAKVWRRAANLGDKNAKEKFYEIFFLIQSCKPQQDHEIEETNQSKRKAIAGLYPIWLEVIDEGDQKIKELVEGYSNDPNFVCGYFLYLVNRGDDDSINKAWELYQNNKRTFNAITAQPLINHYKKKADQGDLEACRRITEMAMPEHTKVVSFKTATEYYAKAIDLKDPEARAGLLRALKRLAQTDSDHVGVENNFLKWALQQKDPELLMAVGDALAKTNKQYSSSRNFAGAAEAYRKAADLGDQGARDKFYGLYDEVKKVKARDSKSDYDMREAEKARAGLFAQLCPVYVADVAKSEDVKLLGLVAHEMLTGENSKPNIDLALEYFFKKAILLQTSSAQVYQEICDELTGIKDPSKRQGFNFAELEIACQTAHSQGNPQAHPLLAEFYSNGLPEGSPFVLSLQKLNGLLGVRQTPADPEEEKSKLRAFYQKGVEREERGVMFAYAEDLLSGTTLDKEEDTALELFRSLVSPQSPQDAYYEKAVMKLGNYHTARDPSKAFDYYLMSKAGLTGIEGFIENPGALPIYADNRDWTAVVTGVWFFKCARNSYLQVPKAVQQNSYGNTLEEIGRAMTRLSSLEFDDAQPSFPGVLMRTRNKVVKNVSSVQELFIGEERFLTVGDTNIKIALLIKGTLESAQSVSPLVAKELEECKTQLDRTNEKMLRKVRLLDEYADEREKYQKLCHLKAKLETDQQHLQQFGQVVSSLKKAIGLSAGDEDYLGAK